ncbi:MAG: hypothetical protein ACK559_19545, partial [bacterium]
GGAVEGHLQPHPLRGEHREAARRLIGAAPTPTLADPQGVVEGHGAHGPALPREAAGQGDGPPVGAPRAPGGPDREGGLHVGLFEEGAFGLRAVVCELPIKERVVDLGPVCGD